MDTPIISIIGLGFVGDAMHNSFTSKKIDVLGYDKFKKCNCDLSDTLRADIIFLCLPTHYNSADRCYDTSVIEQTCEYLNENNFRGAVVCKSTVTPGTCQKLAGKYRRINIIHNPEFLTARTAREDYHNQKHIVLCLSHIHI